MKYLEKLMNSLHSIQKFSTTPEELRHEMQKRHEEHLRITYKPDVDDNISSFLNGNPILKFNPIIPSGALPADSPFKIRTSNNLLNLPHSLMSSVYKYCLLKDCLNLHKVTGSKASLSRRIGLEENINIRTFGYEIHEQYKGLFEEINSYIETACLFIQHASIDAQNTFFSTHEGCLTAKILTDLICALPSDITDLCLPNLEDSHLKLIGAKFPQLRSLNLSRCPKVTDFGITALESLFNLQYLNLHGCFELTDKITESNALLSKLQYLDVSDCRFVTDIGIKAIATLSKLRHLNISGCCMVTDHGIAAIADLTNLESLELQYMQKCEGNGLKLLYSSLKKLRYLNISDNQNFNKKIYKYLSDEANFYELQILNLVYNRLNENEIALLKRARPKLQILVNNEHSRWASDGSVKITCPDELLQVIIMDIGTSDGLQ